ncbi:MAG: endonuclease/exonuclease/phosphatase family protein [Verrucomicrobia bacterium]|nr:endonuclease/exonuclease/phosphatase family protein [Verrucomicrobiota bacterium]
MSCQRLTFMISVSVPGPWKTVEVHWAGEEGRWRSCPAVCERRWGGVGEVWRARILRERGMDEMSLPGDVRFALCCRVDGVESWDNNGGEDYLVRNDSGIRMASSFPLLRVGERPSLGAGESVCPVPVAVQHSIRPGRVFVRWTSDQWRTQRTAPCFFLRRYWSRMQGCNARNPNSYGCGIWLARLPVGDAPSVEFAIGCESAQGPVWDNNCGQNYVVRRGQLRVLTLNLHCRQEANQDAKLRLIASAINELGLDLICLQEVSEPWNEGRGDWSANTARMICEQLRESYSIYWDHSHLGFGRYREGCAVLSRFPMVESESAYVSTSHDGWDIHARKVLRVKVAVPVIGLVNMFCVHLSWWEAGFRGQFERLREWCRKSSGSGVAATLLCGDFNVPTGSEGYRCVLADGEFRDQIGGAPFGGGRVPGGTWMDPSWFQRGRIDHCFMNSAGGLMPVSSRELFNGTEYSRVSDHPGYFVEFEPGVVGA